MALKWLNSIKSPSGKITPRALSVFQDAFSKWNGYSVNGYSVHHFLSSVGVEVQYTVTAAAHHNGFADDIAVVTVSKELPAVEKKTNTAIRHVVNWLPTNGLTLAAHKTVAVLVSCRKVVETDTICVDNCLLHSKPAIRYLGVCLSSYRTVSEDAALVLAGMIPLDLLTMETRTNSPQTTRRAETMEEWLVKSDPALKHLSGDVHGIRKTAKGDLLLRLNRKPEHSADELQEAVGKALGDRAVVRTLTETSQVEIKDLDELATKEEVLEAIKSALQDDSLPIETIKSLRPAFGGQQRATVTLPAPKARTLVEKAKTVREMRIDIAIISEPHHRETNCPRIWTEDQDGKAALWVCGDPSTSLTKTKSFTGFVRAQYGSLWIYSCYLAPSMQLCEFTAALDALVDDARGRKVIIAGDFNAWAVEWGSQATNARGRALLESFAALDIALLNFGSENTFTRGGIGSIIDLTFASSSLFSATKWQLSDLYTASDHSAIICTIGEGTAASTRSLSRKAYRLDTFDPVAFSNAVHSLVTAGNAERRASQMACQLSRACDESMQTRKTFRRHHVPTYCGTKISRGGTASKPEEIAPEEFPELRTEPKMILRARGRSQSQLVVKRLYAGKQAQPSDPSELKLIVETLFPIRPDVLHTQARPSSHVAAMPSLIDEVSVEEVLTIARSLKPSKAPGPDGIPNRALKLAMSLQPAQFVQLFNMCLMERTFPTIWKLQTLVLLPKPGKPPDDPSSYRPICLLDTLGKVLEKLICNRLQVAVDNNGGLSQSQFGFTKAKSTIDALEKVETIRSYFTGRLLQYDTADGPTTHQVSAGVPQGSVLGPLLWNIMYDGILRLELPIDTSIIGFADACLVVVGKELKDVEESCNHSIDRVHQWLAAAGLELAAHKTEAVLVSSRKRVETAHIRVGSATIESARALKYLGVMLDTRMSFREHLEYVHKKAAESCRALSRIMLNTRGPKQQRRRLLMTVNRAVIMYASPIWSRAMALPSYSVHSIYRLSALRVSCAFRTVSDEAALVIAGMVPLDELATEAVVCYRAHNGSNTANSIRTEARMQSVARWQARWDRASKGRWKHRLIPNLEAWINRKGIIEDANHVIFECGRFAANRQELEDIMGRPITVDNLVTHDRDRTKWDAASTFAAEVIRTQES
ncbi:uncharacterized protein LOC135429319 [Drosophila montana]|uniref:uncharacterized protein LOC135429319 n=1 Tax=Drosophila montana TaxID=40370 RepID=UPI00313B7753